MRGSDGALAAGMCPTLARVPSITTRWEYHKRLPEGRRRTDQRGLGSEAVGIVRNLFCIASVETLSTTVQVNMREASCSRERWDHRGHGKRFLYEGWSDGAPVVELGAAKTAPEGVTSGE